MIIKLINSSKMKKYILYTLMIMIFISCSEFDNAISGRIRTLEVTEIKDVSAISGGIIIFDSQNTEGFNQIVQKGIIWSELRDEIQDYSNWRRSSQQNNNPHKDDANGFLCEMRGLKSNTTYYVRAFAQFGKANEGNFAYGVIQSFTTAVNFSLVRFRKVANDPYMTEMAIDDVNEKELAHYFFGSGVGTSQYYVIPPGNHNVWFFDNYPGYEGWHLDFSYNFQSGHKYSLVCVYESDNFTLNFSVTDDGIITNSDIPVRSSTSIEIDNNKRIDSKQNSRTKSIVNK